MRCLFSPSPTGGAGHPRPQPACGLPKWYQRCDLYGLNTHLANIPPFCVLLLQIQAIVEEQRRFPKEHRIGFCNVFSIKGRVKEKKKTGKYQRIGNCLFIKLLEIFTLTKNIKNDNYLIDKIIKLF